MSIPDTCPFCQTNLIDETEVPKLEYDIYEAGPFYRAQAILTEEKEILIQCPDCKATWAY